MPCGTGASKKLLEKTLGWPNFCLNSCNLSTSFTRGFTANILSQIYHYQQQHRVVNIFHKWRDHYLLEGGSNLLRYSRMLIFVLSRDFVLHSCVPCDKVELMVSFKFTTRDFNLAATRGKVLDFFHNDLC